MKRLKINLDRPAVDSKSIQARKDFDGLIKNHAIMTKPFYKSSWFFGTAGLASVGIVVGTVIAFQDGPEEIPENFSAQTTESPMELIIPDNNALAVNSGETSSKQLDNLVQQTLLYSSNIESIDNTPTLNTNPDITNPIVNGELIVNDDLEPKIDEAIIDNDTKKDLNSMLLPRIGGKINGSISKDELFDNKGITTESDVSVIHFELHLIDGLGGKVFEEESNQLNDEMKAALKKISGGETIFFENIKGKTEKGDVVRLNPLRYVLMN
jgi:hypothetical protein